MLRLSLAVSPLPAQLKDNDNWENVMRIFLAAMMAATALTGAAQAETTVIHAGRLITDAARPASGPSTITVTDGKIVSIADGYAAAPADARVVDLKTKTVLPGLIDMHVHLESDPGGDFRDETIVTDDYLALASATTVAAKLLDKENEIGKLAPGYSADIIAVDGDPLTDVRSLEKVGFVMARGRIID